jgi:alanine dehydrogenase
LRAVTERATRILTRADVAALLDLGACVAAVEDALRAHADGRTLAPAVLAVRGEKGGLHVKAAGLRGARTYLAAKTNANFPGNPEHTGLPTIQGVIVLCDGDDGFPLAVMDSIEITAARTAAATAVAARRLARPESTVATVVGCGQQARSQIEALRLVLPLAEVHVLDRDPDRARAFAAAMSSSTGMAVNAREDLAAAARTSDVIVTCTPSRQAFLRPEHVAPGTLVAAVGADSPEKQELDPRLLAFNTVVVDLLDSCAAQGDLHHALAAGLMSRSDVHAELAEVVAGTRPGRRAADEIVVFDSTGTALQDVAAAALVFERAEALGRGARVPLTAAPAR